MRWLRFTLSLLLLAAAIAGLVSYTQFSAWRDSHIDALANTSRVVQTEVGQVEVAVTGTGPAILTVHGTPGGFDQVASTGSLFPKNHQQIAMSRPGYLRTPISSGRTPQEQAELHVALLDKLGINKAIALGVSGGGPSVIRLALDHPERTRAIVLLSARMRTKPKPSDDDGFSIRSIFSQDFLVWLFSEQLADGLVSDVEAKQLTPYARQTFMQIVMSSVPEEMRATGKANDLIQMTDPRLNTWPLNEITAPTLIIHGLSDTGTDVEEAEYVRDQIPHAELVFLEGGHFIGTTHAEEIRQIISQFVNKLPPVSSPTDPVVSPAGPHRPQFPLASLRQLAALPRP